MDYKLTAIEKAFQLARFGNCRSLDYLTKQLRHEGYDTTQIYGKALRKQLLQIIREPVEQRKAPLRKPRGLQSPASRSRHP
jgi:hypothetical protein